MLRIDLPRLSGLQVLALTAAGALLLGALLPARGLYGIDICLFHRMTGIPCPGCGMTRAFTALVHGQMGRAWRLHPFAFPLFGVTCLSVVAPMAARWFPALQGPTMWKGLGLAATGLGCAMLVFGVARMLGAYPWP